MSSSAFATSYRRDLRLVRTNAMRIWVVFLVAFVLYLPWVVQQKSLFGFELSYDEVAALSALERGRIWDQDPETYEEF